MFSRLIDMGFEVTGDAFLLYTNSDIALVADAKEELAPFLQEGRAFYVPNKQVKVFNRFYRDSSQLSKLPSPQWGADTFLISRGWWEANRSKLPDFLIGYPVWDEFLINLIGKDNLLPSISYHEEHDSYWKSADAAFDRGILHNFACAGFNSLAVVIPCYCKDLTSLRLRNLLFVLQRLRKSWNGPVFVALQEGSHESIPCLLESLGVKTTIVRSTSTTCHKAKLVNEAVKSALAFYPFDYILQLDADLFQKKLGGMIWNWVRQPLVDSAWLYKDFFFLTRKMTEKITSDQVFQFKANEIYKSNGFGPGGFLVSRRLFEEIGGMDESFTGWGLEDTVFGDEVLKRSKPQACAMNGFHLYHENDRELNLESFERIKRFDPGSLEECKYLSSAKLCILNTGRCGSTMLARALCIGHDSLFIAEEPFNRDYVDVSPIQFLKKQLVTPESLNPKYKTLGFRLWLNQPAGQDNQRKQLWSHLENRDYTIIYLYRESLFDWIASHFLAAKYDAYEERDYPGTVHVDLEEATLLWQEFMLLAVQALNLARSCVSVAFSFEELCYSWDASISKVQKVLGLEQVSLKPTTRPQSEHFLASYIENAEELQAWTDEKQESWKGMHEAVKEATQ